MKANKNYNYYVKFLAMIGLTMFVAACGSRDLSDEKARTADQQKQLQQRMLAVQTDR
ncbi:MAG TPA: hypothetical protein VK973_16010 [Arenicellales bacterium]|nr:hypothetical protein [Arenicellales bacterium]